MAKEESPKSVVQTGRRIFIKRTLLAATVLSLPVFSACGGGSGSDDSERSESSSSSSSSSASVATTAKFAVLSDPHLYDLDTLGSNSDLTTYLAADRKMLKESVPIFDAAMADIATWEVDFLLIAGDLTKDGELVDHNLMAARLASFGKPVYVVPGNHDVNNPDAKSFGTTTTSVTQVSPSDFKSIYAGCGYDSALYTDSDSLSYIAEPVSGVWLFAIDSCKYTNNATLGYPVTSGAISSTTLAWITTKLAEAQSLGKVVIGMMHHGLIEHFSGQSTLFADYLVDERASVAATLAAAGLTVMFTGHFHANDVVAATYSDTTVYDVETGSLVTAPSPYRLCTFDRSAGTLSIATSVVKSITVTNAASDYTSGEDFQTYATDYLTTGLETLVSSLLQSSYGITDATTIAQAQALIVPAMVAHYAGDESLTDATTLATLTGMASSSNSTYQLIGNIVLALWNDGSPADNTVSLPLTT